jgi:hypothetical protein
MQQRPDKSTVTSTNHSAIVASIKKCLLRYWAKAQNLVRPCGYQPRANERIRLILGD